MPSLPCRQVHLDFHTSPSIPDIGIDFNPEEFVATLRRGHVNSVTVFAKCHHGYSYYPTKVGTVHPNLRRPDLLGEMIDASHRAGLRVPVYTTVTWDELAWHTHPEWRQVGVGGSVVGPSTSPLMPGWKNLCMNTGYGDYVIAQIEEILDLYDGDGLFIDIVRYIPSPCVCSTCLRQMAVEGVDPELPDQLRAFSQRVERRFMARATAAIRAKKPEQHIFYNSRLRMAIHPHDGNRAELNDFTHLEIESLPGGEWGYAHFPMYVRYFQTFDRELMAMTGRFHTSWGDFGGLRHRAALEFEAFEALAHGAAVSIGDQLHPRGRLDPAVYDRIGEVYAKVEACEPWCLNTQAEQEVGVFTASTAGGSASGGINPVDQGTLNALEQLKVQFQYLDEAVDLTPYAVVILPDSIPVGRELADRLRTYVKGGGKLLITGRSSLDEEASDFVLADVMGVHYAGPAPYAPDYLVLSDELCHGIEPTPPVCELQGVSVRAGASTHVLATSGAPYFNRTWQHFCSHRYTPFDRDTESPVITQSDGAIFIARPLFSEYAESGRRVHKTVIANCLLRLLPEPIVGEHNLPSTAVVTVRRGDSERLVHVLHYVHQRRGRGIDIIEDVLPLRDVRLSIRAESRPTYVELVPQRQPLDWSYSDGYVHMHVPRVEGYQIIRIA